MRIAINCRSFLLKNYTGIGRYAYNLVKSLSFLDYESEYVLYARKGLFDFKRALPKVGGKNFHPCIDWQGQGPAKALKLVDIYHSPSPDRLPDIKAKIIVTVHDRIYKMYPQGHTEETIDATQKYFEEMMERADKIICCSKNTLEDLKKFFPVDERKTAVVYQGVDGKVFHRLGAEEEKEAGRFLEEKGITSSFLLFIGTIEPRKNLSNLIKAFALLKQQKAFDGKLVVAGMKGWMQEHISSMIAQEGLGRDVIFLGYLSDFELCALYNKTKAFVFPSFYEGFGFPILEAFQCGAAVVTSKSSSCGEVASNGAVLIDPSSPDDIASGIKKILSDERFVSALKEKALRRAQDFSFEKTAQETFKVYQEVYQKV